MFRWVTNTKDPQDRKEYNIIDQACLSSQGDQLESSLVSHKKTKTLMPDNLKTRMDTKVSYLVVFI